MDLLMQRLKVGKQKKCKTPNADLSTQVKEGLLDHVAFVGSVTTVGRNGGRCCFKFVGKGKAGKQRKMDRGIDYY